MKAFIPISLSFFISLALPPALPSGSAGAEQGLSAPGELRLVRREVVDAAGFGYEAFSVLVPGDWSFSGQVSWTFPSGMAMPELYFIARSPDGNAVFEQLPAVNFMWASDPMMVYGFQQQGTRTMPPMALEEFVRNMYLPQLRGAVSGLKVVSVRPVPEEAERTARMGDYLVNHVFHSISPHTYMPQVGADAALVEIEYGYEGRQWVETLLVVLSYQTTYTPGMMGLVSIQPWGITATSLRVVLDQAESVATVAPVIMRSAQANPRWLVDHTRLTAFMTRQALAQQREIFNAMRSIAASRAEISDMISEGYSRRSAAMDRIHESRVQSIRGVETYRDPLRGASRVELPSGYDQAWSNGTDIVLSNDPRFDPSALGGVGWSRMERQGR